jgi:predicted peptidase
MKNIATLLVLLLSTVANCKKDRIGKNTANEIPETQPPVQKAISEPVNNNIGGYLETLPARYDSTTKRYPLLIFMHGLGELGNGTTDLPKAARNGTTALIRNQKFPPSFTVDNKSYSFIVIAPQFKQWPYPVDVNDMINYAISHYRIDTTRLYVSGLSMGGGITWEYAAVNSRRIAAIVPICGASAPTDIKAQDMAHAGLPVWAFHNKNDSVVTYTFSTGYVSKINSFHPNPPARLTVWETGGHNAWSKATDPSYKEEGKNMYEWMLQYVRPGSK